jgi:hypothetical protein
MPLAERVASTPCLAGFLRSTKQRFNNKTKTKHMADNPSKKTGKHEIPSTLASASKASPSAVFSRDIKRIVLERPGTEFATADQALWGTIRNRTTAANFNYFERLVELVFCQNKNSGRELKALDDGVKKQMNVRPFLDDNCLHGPEAYSLLKATAEVFLALQCGVKVEPLVDPNGDTPPFDSEIEGEADRGTDLTTFADLKNELTNHYLIKPGTLPYLERIIEALKLLPTDSPLCDGFLRGSSHLGNDRKPEQCFPCLLELIWSYWHEEGMLVQSINAICLRFQNKRSPRLRDPLANFRLDPLRPLNTLLWGYIQDEINRLTVARRALEYDQEYGLHLMGKAVPEIQSVDSRSKFLEAFHNLLYVASRFYKEADDTTVKADAFPVLNALRELHLILAQGAHNQFGDLPWTARVEMLIQKWLLARQEIREFLGGAPMVPYKESWMGHVDAMKTLQGWSDVSVSHYRDLGVYGEQILLSVRYGDWIDDLVTQANAYNWAISWRPEIQSYMHSYRAVTGIDLSAELADTNSAAQRFVQPAVHQMRRLGQQRAQRSGGLPSRNGKHEEYSTKKLSAEL